MATRLSIARSNTLIDLGAERLRSLALALGYEAAQVRSIVQIFERMAASWGRFRSDRPSQWPSDITDDHTPFEFSLAIDGGVPELRFLLEVQGETPSLASNWEAALAMNEVLAAEYGADLSRFAAVQDLFAPTAECRRFTLWHAVCFQPGAPPQFKVYLNPQARGRAHAREIVAEAMARLGFEGAAEHLPAHGAEDEICYFSLDLSGREGARLKVYTAHPHATPARIEAAVSCARSHMPGRASAFCEAMAASDGPFNAQPVLTCLSFVEGSAQPTTGTIHFPVRSYANDDRTVRERVLGYIHTAGATIYRRALETFADRQLEDGIGMQTYVSLRLDRGRDRLTVYLAPEVYEIRQSAMTQPIMSGVISRRASSRPPKKRMAAVGDVNE